MRFDDGKTEALNLRVSPSFKAALKRLAEAENRSMVNMLEVLVMETENSHAEHQRLVPTNLAPRTHSY